MTSRQWGSLFTDDILSDEENSDDQQYMNTLWGFIIQKYADISVPHLEHITGTGTCCYGTLLFGHIMLLVIICHENVLGKMVPKYS